MMASLLAAFPAIAIAAVALVFVAGALVYYALRSKGDVFAELSLGRTTFRIDARDKQQTRELHKPKAGRPDPVKEE